MKSISHSINESVSRTKLLNAIYKEIERSRITSKLYHDEHWQGPNEAFKLINDVIDRYGDGEYKVIYSVPDGGYRKSKDGMSQWKEYDIDIYKDDDTRPVISGHLNAHAAGKVNDPFSSYDMTIVLSKI